MIDIHARAVRNRIEGWQQAGLLDDATAARLVDHEAARPSTSLPLLTSIGGISIALGIIALVSANWDELPIALKLGVHFALNLGLGAGLWWGVATDRLGYFGREVLSLILSAATLALIAHIGQSFHLQGNGFSAMLFWLMLVTPFTVSLTRSIVNRAVWLAGLGTTIGLGFDLYFDLLVHHQVLTATCAVLLIAAYGAPALTHERGALALWGRDLQNIALIILVTVVAITQFIWEQAPFRGNPNEVNDFIHGAIVAAVGFGLARMVMLWRKAVLGGSHGLAMTAFVVLSPLAAIPPVIVNFGRSAFVAAAAFCLYCAVIAVLAQWFGRVWVYRLAVIAITLRILAVFFEAFYGLLATGIGLIITGLVLLGTGWALRHLLSRTSPPSPDKKEVTP